MGLIEDAKAAIELATAPERLDFANKLQKAFGREIPVEGLAIEFEGLFFAYKWSEAAIGHEVHVFSKSGHCWLRVDSLADLGGLIQEGKVCPNPI